MRWRSRCSRRSRTPFQAEPRRGRRALDESRQNPVGCELGLQPVAVSAEVQRSDLLPRLADQVALMGTFP